MPINTSELGQTGEVTAATMSYPVFPLPVFLLPGGMQRLRIFEQKYISMVANATNTDGFVMSLHKKDQPFSTSAWGVHVNIVDFSNGNDGILTIDVLAGDLLTLSNFSHDNKGLLFADAELLPHWSVIPGTANAEYKEVEDINHNLTKTAKVSPKSVDNESDDVTSLLSLFLQQIFRDNSELSRLYKTQHFDYSNWVSSRLLEVIPIPVNEKEKFVHHLELNQLNQLLRNLCEKNQ